MCRGRTPEPIEGVVHRVGHHLCMGFGPKSHLRTVGVAVEFSGTAIDEATGDPTTPPGIQPTQLSHTT
jgi:hypothetical protein